MVAQKLLKVKQLTPQPKPKQKAITIPGAEKNDFIIPEDTRNDKSPRGTITTEEGIGKVIILKKIDKSKRKEKVIEKELKVVNPKQAQIDEDEQIAKKLLEDEQNEIFQQNPDEELAKEIFADDQR